ncbi:MAG TPA: 16S rRNA (uracil(1498)-N(3))-methyltransferase [Steroidobacteraceae bacterium]|nr:16S rRNA (uracil(1498)-N(3))-methyltransferase [Steroidobacteraceae bacterium]
MRTTRIHVELELHSGAEVLLPPAASTHLLRVLRLKAGATLTLFNGQGGEYAAELASAERSGARVRVGAASAIERESPLHITLLQGVARGERMDFIVQKATELGVQRIVPLSCEFSVVRLDAAALRRRVEHWRSVAIAACEQCGRNRLPQVDTITSLEDACGGSGEELKVVLVPQAPATLRTLSTAPRPVVLLVGPEGGLSGREQLLAQRHGFQACRLGPRILRTETAPLAALAALQALCGDLAS